MKIRVKNLICFLVMIGAMIEWSGMTWNRPEMTSAQAQNHRKWPEIIDVR